ncbi:MAG: hypothetical protein MJK04_28605, partial [Psychrosphaera sp.]|nr:hypothetical protein [Psychrosphaera sp.]
MTASFEQQFGQLPGLLQQCGNQHWQEFLENAPALCQSFSVEQCMKAKYCFALSDFVAQSCIYQNDVFEHVFVEDGPAFRALDQYAGLVNALDEVEDENDFIRQIRRLRKSLMVNIAVTDLTKRQTVAQSFTLISQLSDLLIQAAYLMAYRQVSKSFGKPQTDTGEDMTMIILGMGKL